METPHSIHGFMGRDGLSPGSSSKLYLKSISIKGGEKSYSTSEAAPFCLVAPWGICCLSEVPFAQTTMERFLLIERGAALINAALHKVCPFAKSCTRRNPAQQHLNQTNWLNWSCSVERVLHLGPINGRLRCDVHQEERIKQPAISRMQVELRGAKPPLLRGSFITP